MKFGDYSQFSFVDVETTGTSASHDRVLEIGIIRVDNGKVVGQMNTLLDPGVYIPPEITMITGITDQDIRHAPTFPDIIDEVQELLGDSVFVAHNARFDHAFMKHEFRRLGLPFNPKTLDTVKLSRKLYPALPRHNLDAIIAFLGVTVEKRHRAYDDALVLYELMKRIHIEFPEEHTHEIFKVFLKSPSLPTHIAREQIDALPEGPGVYTMYGEDDTILYIGKSVDIRARVLSHFYNDFDSQTDLKLSRDVRRIDTISTAGDMGASLRESTLIKSHQPAFNRALRRSLGMIAMIQTEKGEFLSVDFIPAHEIRPEDHHTVIGIFRSKKQAQERLTELAKEYKLCPKLLGLEKGGGRCFASQIGNCLGACNGNEPAFKYNVRFVEAFANLRVPIWPFPGPIGIHEKFEEIEELHVIHNWCYLGSIEHDSDDITALSTDNVRFDWDVYKIVYRFIKKHAKTNSIIVLPTASKKAQDF